MSIPHLKPLFFYVSSYIVKLRPVFIVISLYFLFKVWCGYRNKLHVLQPHDLQVVHTLEAHPRRESPVSFTFPHLNRSSCKVNREAKRKILRGVM